ncbi:MAG: beta-lactamase family protein [Candidatus Krumholzibacteriota bacterium]|nr:beta-lactamase family protein [Candidatus Krumholzibacteriota bacterium]
MRPRPILAATLCALLAMASASPAAAGGSPAKVAPELAARLQAVLDSALAASGTMGCSAAVIMPDGRLWAGASGLSHPGAPVTPDMLFDMGSTGKHLMAALVLMLAEDGLLSLEDPVGKYLPPLPNVDGAITIRQCLNHTSGLYMWVEHPRCPINIPFDRIDFEKTWTVEEIFTTLGGEPYFAPGEGWHYTQAGFLLVREIVERVTGQAVPELVQRRLLDPLDIHGMLLDLRDPLPVDRPIAHAWYDTDKDGTPEDISGKSRNWLSSLSGILFYTTMESLARWCRGLYDGEVLSPESLDAMLDFVAAAPEEGLAGYGLGTERWFMGPVEMLGHKGSIFGYRAAVYHLVEQDITVALAINSDSDEKGYAMFGPLIDRVTEPADN